MSASDEEVSARAARVKVIAFDVDGVATDGRLFYGKDGCELHAFHARDGLGLVRAREAGIVLAAISGRRSPNVDARLTELRVAHIHQGIHDKLGCLRGIVDGIDGVSLDDVCYVGDDVNDLACLEHVGLACAPHDAVADVIARVHWVSSRDGGHGVLRDVVELVLRAQQRWVVG